MSETGPAFPAGRWFGDSWGAPACEPDRHAPTPIGESCVYCPGEIGPNDQGLLIPHLGEHPITSIWGEGAAFEHDGYRAAHIDCFLREVGIATADLPTLGSDEPTQAKPEPDLRELYEWRYAASNARVAHAIEELELTTDGMAVCGRTSTTWYGTGSHYEQQRLRGLPLCGSCRKMLLAGRGCV